MRKVDGLFLSAKSKKEVNYNDKTENPWTIESLAPEVKDLTRTEMTELMEYIFSLPEVQRAVRHMAITHISQANREKELKADGTISSERHAD